MARDSKAINDLIKLAEDQGWEVKRTRNGHIRFLPKDKSMAPVVSSGTHSTTRGLGNLRSDLRRSGLKFPDNAGQVPDSQKERQLAQNVEKLREVVITSADHRNPDSMDIELLEIADVEMLSLLSLFIDEGGRLQTICACGRQMHRIVGFVRHLANCEKSIADVAQRYAALNLPEKEPMKRDMQRPPDRERLDCPECSVWFWVSQPHLHEQHMAGEHGMKKCPYCDEWVRMENGQITKHINSCDKRPEGTPPVSAMVVPVIAPAPSKPARRRSAAAKTTAEPAVGGQQEPSRTVKPPRNQSTPPPHPDTEKVNIAPVPSVVPEAPTELQAFVWRRVGHKVTASVYHLYKDCGMVASEGGETGETIDDAYGTYAPVEHVNVDDTMIDLLGLRCCRVCDRRSKKVTVEQIVTEWFHTMDAMRDRTELALQFLIDLADYGYAIKKER